MSALRISQRVSETLTSHSVTSETIASSITAKVTDYTLKTIDGVTVRNEILELLQSDDSLTDSERQSIADELVNYATQEITYYELGYQSVKNLIDSTLQNKGL